MRVLYLHCKILQFVFASVTVAVDELNPTNYSSLCRCVQCNVKTTRTCSSRAILLLALSILLRKGGKN